MRRRLSVLSVVLFAVLSHLGFATSAQVMEDFRHLKDVPDDYEIFGTVCEQVARLRMAEEYPAADYEIIVGITYTNKVKTLGELDVIVFRRTDSEAIMIAEVKCWRDLRAAHDKAMNQLSRFQRAVKINDIKTMYLNDNNKIQYKPSQFDEPPEYLTIAQDDNAEAAGFDRNIGLDMEEVKILRQMLIDCHEHGRCSP